MRVGYVRVSTVDQNTVRQLDGVDVELAERYQALGRWARRRVDPVADAAAYDETGLLVCDLCAIAVPADVGEQWWTVDDDRPQCRQCGTGHLIAYAGRGQVPTLDERLAQLRARFTVRSRGRR